MAKIRKIEPKTPKIKKRKKVAAYARVSAESDRMMHSLSAQVSYYSKLIQENPEWEYAGVYADSFISGTGIKQRKEFQRLVEDCEQGKIDIVLCKSISRFARNTVDLLETVRHLKELGIEVRFEKERINSLSGDGELMLSLLACFAQEESHSISENSKWGIRKRFESGEIGTANKHILGYQYDETLRKYVIIPEEAEIVRKIVELYLERIPLRDICDDLNDRGWRTVNGCLFQEAWMSTMLRNEVYAGDTLRQKKYIEDPITKNKVKNKGELPMYYMPDTHEAIIDRETWEKVQEEVARRESLLNPTYCFSGRIKCDICGRPYTRHADWAKGKLYPRWICRAKKEPGITCSGVNYSEKKLREISVEILGLADFDETAFEERVREMTVLANGDIVFNLFGGETKMWVRPPKPVKPPQPVREKKPPEHCFDGKIFCGNCGRRFGRVKSDTKDHHIYWRCRAKSSGTGTCDSVNYPDAELKSIFCELMGQPEFDEDYFNKTVDRIVVQKTGSVDIHLKDGTLRTFKALKLRVNKHISTSTDEFAGKIRCAACGNLFKRSVHRGKYVYWHCSGKDKVRTECKARNIADNEIRQVAAYVMEMDEFNVPEFERQIDHITMEEDGSMDFTFYDGREIRWQRR